jgi:hypothetical protein
VIQRTTGEQLEGFLNGLSEVDALLRLLNERSVLSGIDASHVNGKVEKADRVGGLVVVESWKGGSSVRLSIEERKTGRKKRGNEGVQNKTHR